jgi:hypothetical protein
MTLMTSATCRGSQVFLCFLLSLTACGESGSKTRAPSAGNVYVPPASVPEAKRPSVLGSEESSEIQGVRDRYVVPLGSTEFSVSVKVANAQKRSPVKILFNTLSGTLPPVEAEPSYNAAVVTVSLAGAPEGVHMAAVGALYEGDERGPTVNFEIQVGPSTAPARPRATTSAANPAQETSSSASTATANEETMTTTGTPAP